MITVYLASWTPREHAELLTSDRTVEHRVTRHVDADQFAALREDPMVIDLRGIEVTQRGLLYEPSRDEMGWLQGGRGGPKCGRRTDLEDLAADVVRLLPPDEGGEQVQDDPVERRQAFAQHLTLFALVTAGQPGSPLERARRVASQVPPDVMGGRL